MPRATARPFDQKGRSQQTMDHLARALTPRGQVNETLPEDFVGLRACGRAVELTLEQLILFSGAILRIHN